MKINNIFKSLNIKSTDILLVSSDVTNLLTYIYKNEGKIDLKNNTELNLLINNMQEIIGNEGTLLFPTYNWDFCQGGAFDYHKSPSKTGLLSVVALQRNDFKRTKHPIYSFAVWGKYQNYLCSLDNTDSFGADSPFDFLYNKHGKNLIIDVDYNNCFTFIHYVEQSIGVSYRYIKNFNADYIDENQKCENKQYSMYVRNLDLDVENNANPIGNILENMNIAKKQYINNIPFIIVDLYPAFDIIKDDIINNSGRNIVKYKGQ